MKVGLVNSVNFRANEAPTTETKVEHTETTTTSQTQEPDSFTPQADVQPEKRKKTVKDRVAGFWKFLSTTNQMTRSALKGVFYGAMTGVALLGGSWVFKALPNAFSKQGPTLMNTIKHPLKAVGKSGKIMAGIGAGAVLAYQLITGKLEANQKTAVIDHKMYTGHRDK